MFISSEVQCYKGPMHAWELQNLVTIRFLVRWHKSHLNHALVSILSVLFVYVSSFCKVLLFSFYPAIRRIGWDTKFTVAFLFIFFYVRSQITQLGLYQSAGNLHGSSATSRTGFLPFWGDSPREGQIMGVNRGPYGGICFLLKHLLFCNLVAVSFGLLIPAEQLVGKTGFLH